MTAANYNSRRAALILGETGSEVDVTCYLRKLSLTAEDEETDEATFCTPGAKGIGETTWTLVIEIKQSFGEGAQGSGTEGFYDSVKAMQRSIVPFLLKLDKTAANPTAARPHFSGEVQIPTLSIIDAEIAATSDFTYTLPVQGEPLELDGS